MAGAQLAVFGILEAGWLLCFMGTELAAKGTAVVQL